MTYDPATKSIVLFGGERGPGALGDTWTWQDGSWTEQHPATSPPPRAFAVMAYSPGTKEVVLFGGEQPTTGAKLGDTWTWNGTSWTERHPAESPSPRLGAALALDAKTGDDILFGGLGYGFYHDTWAWDGNAWTEEHPGQSPPALGGAALAWDAPQQELVLYGGVTRAKRKTVTWTWSGADWHSHAGRPNPGVLQTTEAVSAGQSGALLFGGLALTTDSTLGGMRKTWLWEGNRWRRVDVASSPPRRHSASIAYDGADQRVVLFGGMNSYTHQLFGDTWTFR